MRLAAEGLSVRYPTRDREVVALSRVDLGLAPGETLGLVGASGCGKSTLARAILGLLPRTARIEGSLRLDGEELVGRTEAEFQALRGRRVALIPQGGMSALNPVLRIGGQIAESAVIHRGMRTPAAEAHARELLARVGLDPDLARRFPHELSGGMRQRVVLAVAIAGGADLLVADEPTTGLDLLVQARILSLLRQLRDDLDLTLLLISHDIDVVTRLAHRVAVMDAGRIVECAPAETLRDTARHPRTRALLRTLPRTPVLPLRPLAPARRPRLHVRNLTTVFAGRGHRPEVRAVDGLDLEIAAGEAVGLIGESGSGKTTVARSLLRLVEPRAGRIRLDGVEILSLGRRALRGYRRRVSMVHQDPYASLHPAMRVRDLVGEPLRIAGLDAGSERVEAVLSACGIAPRDGLLDRRPSELSGGQRQRVALARALAPEPRLLIADEPTSMLDAHLRQDILGTLARLRDAFGLSILLITHDLAEAFHLCDRIVVMQGGREVESGTSDTLRHHARHPHTRALLGAAGARRSPAPGSLDRMRPSRLDGSRSGEKE